MSERFLVTGAAGCLGAWVVAQLIEEGVGVVAFDLSDDRRRLRLVVDGATAEGVEWVQGDLRDFEQVSDVITRRGITHVVHLAALQVPFCKADPVLGSQVNVTGSVNVLESARRTDGQVQGISYASSVAVYGPADAYPGGAVDDESVLMPSTLYGVYKQANEATARVYFDDWGVSSVGLRPCIVYGPGRDQGMTSGPTAAMLNAAAGISTHISFGGSSTFHHAADVAAAMIAAARVDVAGAVVHNVGGADATIAEVAAAIAACAPGVRVTYDETPLALPARVDGAGLQALLGDRVVVRSLAEGVAESVAQFADLIRRGLLTGET